MNAMDGSSNPMLVMISTTNDHNTTDGNNNKNHSSNSILLFSPTSNREESFKQPTIPPKFDEKNLLATTFLLADQIENAEYRTGEGTSMATTATLSHPTRSTEVLDIDISVCSLSNADDVQHDNEYENAVVCKNLHENVVEERDRYGEKENEEKTESKRRDEQDAEDIREENKPDMEMEAGEARDTREQQAAENIVHQLEQQERRTSDLIRKQLTEIEKEIARRMQNKNVKKMDEQEMNQLLLDHGRLAELAAAAAAATSLGVCGHDAVKDQPTQFPLPFSSGNATDPTAKFILPSLDEIHQIANPSITTHLFQQQPAIVSYPSSLQSQSLASGIPSLPMQFGTTATNAASIVGYNQNFGGPVKQFVRQQQQHAIPTSSAVAEPIFLPQTSQNFVAAAFNPQSQQQSQPAPLPASQSPSPPMAQILPPNLSAITPEMVAALLAQLQQQNPALLQNIVQQQKQQHSDSMSPSPTRANPQANRISATISASSSTRMDVSSSSTDPLFQNDGTMPTTTGHQFSRIALLPAPPRAYNMGAATSRRTLSRTDSVEQKRRASISGIHKTASGGEEELVGALGQRRDSLEWKSKTGIQEEKSMTQPIWVMRDSYLKRQEREEQRQRRELAREEGMELNRKTEEEHDDDEEEKGGEMDKLLLDGVGRENVSGRNDEGRVEPPGAQQHDEQQLEDGQQGGGVGRTGSRKGSKKEVLIHEPAVLIEGVLFRARYLGSTQMNSDGRPTKSSRMEQAQEAVARVKAPEGEPQPSTEIDLFISTEKIMVLNTDLQDILMDHSLRSISYIADIGDLVVLMARRVPTQQEQSADEGIGGDGVRKTPRVICHVFESEEANFIAQSIGQAFQVAYMEFLRANGIEDPNYLRDIDYQEVLNAQEMMAEELELLARKETQKDVVVAKKAGEALGVVIVESGWGSMLPTQVIANMAPGGAAARCNQLNIGDQIIGINGISLVGLPLSTAQHHIKNARSSTAVRLTVVSTPPVVEVRIRRPDTKYQLGFSVQNGVICSLLRGGIAERGGIRVGHRIIEINHQSVVAIPHERIVNMLATSTGEIHMKTMPTSMFRLLTGQEMPSYI